MLFLLFCYLFVFLESTQLLRYAGDELIKEGEQIQGTSDTFYLGKFL